MLVPEDSEGYESILDALASAALLGTLDGADSRQRQAQGAHREHRGARCAGHDQSRRSDAEQAKASGSSEPISVNVIGGDREQSAARGAGGDQLGVADEPARPDFDCAAEKVSGTAKRWGIEIWHKVLKSGCKVEDCLLEEAERLTRYLTLFSIIGVRLMHVAYLARVQPDLPATEVFSAEEIEALHVRVTKALPPAEQPRACAKWCACSAASAVTSGASATASPA